MATPSAVPDREKLRPVQAVARELDANVPSLEAVDLRLLLPYDGQRFPLATLGIGKG